jgi:hypothetical protein
MTDTLSDLVGQMYIDSRDLLERLDELEAREDDTDDEPAEGDVAQIGVDPLDEDERDELKMLRELQTETEGYAGDSWEDGVTFIRDSDFERYAEELADDIGAIDRNAGWPLSYIDWSRAADALKQDYTSCEINGVEYWYR